MSENSWFVGIASQFKQHLQSSHAYASSRVRPVTISVWLSSLMFSGRAVAQEEQEVQCGNLPEQLEAIRDLLHQVQLAGMAIGFSLAAALIVYAGIMWMTGDPSKQERVRKIIINTIIGLLIVVLAGGLVEWVRMIICGGGG